MAEILTHQSDRFKTALGAIRGASLDNLRRRFADQSLRLHLEPEDKLQIVELEPAIHLLMDRYTARAVLTAVKKAAAERGIE